MGACLVSPPEISWQGLVTLSRSSEILPVSAVLSLLLVPELFSVTAEA